MSNPRVSVIIPVWGEYKKYLPRCLESVYTQTYRNIEIILIDSETSVPKAVNKGIERAKGKYITHIGADDTWFPDKIKRQVECMESEPECSLCTCYSFDTRFYRIRTSTPKEITTYRDMIKAFNYSSGSTYLWRRKYNIYYDESLLSGQDFDFALKICKSHGYAKCLPYVGVRQFSTPGQISTNWTKKIKGIYRLAQFWGYEYSIIDWLKVIGLLGLYTLGFIFNVKIYSLITWGKKLYE